MSKLLIWGNALGLRVPKGIYTALGWRHGTVVRMTLGPNHTAIVSKADAKFADERYNVTTDERRPSVGHPHLRVLKRLESQWAKAYNDLVSLRDKLPPTDLSLPEIRQAIILLESDTYQHLNNIINRMEEEG